MIQYIASIGEITWSFLSNAAPWIILSFLLAMLLHNTVSNELVTRHLGSKSLWSMIKVTLIGMLLPICDCGAVPLGISLYYSGAFLGPVLNFITSTPMINPASIILSYGLLGRDITIIYVIAGFTIPLLVGTVANRLAGDELSIHTNPKFKGKVEIRPSEKKSFIEAMKDGFYYVMEDFGPTVSKFTLEGTILAAFITVVVPVDFVQNVLGKPNLMSIGVTALLAAVIFVCAIGHIPFVAALLASGASPGTALTFLMIGSATNFTENVNLYRMIGKKSMLLNLVQLIIYGTALGYITNLLLMPGFTPVIDIDRNMHTVDFANSAVIIFPKSIEVISGIIIILLAFKSLYPVVMNRIDAWRSRHR